MSLLSVRRTVGLLGCIVTLKLPLKAVSTDLLHCAVAVGQSSYTLCRLLIQPSRQPESNIMLRYPRRDSAICQIVFIAVFLSHYCAARGATSSTIPVLVPVPVPVRYRYRPVLVLVAYINVPKYRRHNRTNYNKCTTTHDTSHAASIL